MKDGRQAAGVRANLARFGITAEELKENQRLRAEFRLARFMRRRSARRAKAKWKGRYGVSRKMKGKLFAGEGEFHALLRLSGLTEQMFAKIAGITHGAVSKWSGHPLMRWPAHMLRLIIWAQNARAWMEKNSVNADQFNAVLPTKLNQGGRYPRKPGDVEIPKA